MTEFRDLVEKLNILSENAPNTLSATERARDISPVLGEPEKDHPFNGKLVGEAKRDTHCSDKCCGADVKAEDCGCPPDCKGCNCNAPASEINEAEESVNEHDSGNAGAMSDLQDIVDELDDLSRRAAQILGNHFPEAARRAEAYGALRFGSSSNPHDTTLRSIIDDIENGEYDEEDDVYEDILGDLGKKIGDVLKDVADSLENDNKDLLDKPKEPKGDTIGPAVKTIKTDDGHELKIHGNEDDGFRITIKNKPSKSSFNSLDEAVMAVEMYCARKK